MAISVSSIIGAVAGSSSGSANTVTITKPTTLANGDLMVAFVAFRNSGGTMTAPTGWSQLGPFNTTNQTYGAFYKPVPTASAETATSYAFSTSAGSSRVAGMIYTVQGADLNAVVHLMGSNSAYTGTTNITLPGISPTKAVGLFGFAMNNISTTGNPSMFTAPSGMTTIYQIAADNGTSASMTIWSGWQNVAAGNTGDKVAAMSPTAANSGGYLVAVTPILAANVLPIASAGANKTGSVGTALTFTGTDSDSDGAITARAWTVVSHSGTTAPTLANASTATVTVTPQSTGLTVLRYSVTDDRGDTTTATTKLFVPSLTVTPISVGTTAWSNVGGAANQALAMADSDDTTLAQSAATTSSTTVRLAPISPPATTFSMTVRSKLSDSGAGVATAALVENGTTRKTWTLTPTQTIGDANLTMTQAEASTVTSWNELDLVLTWTV